MTWPAPLGVPAPAAVVAGPPPGPARLPRRGALPTWALLPLAAAVWWVGGYLWWLLGSSARGGSAMALPLHTSVLSGLVLGAVAGGIGAGLLARLTGRRGPALAATAGGVALAVLVTLVQSSSAVRGAAAGSFAADPRVLTGLTVVVVCAALAGWLLGSAAVLGRPGLGVALAVLAGLAPSWVGGVLSRLAGPEAHTALDRTATWSGAAVLALALVVVGLHPPARLVWWPVVLVAAWFTGPALTALVYLGPSLRSGAGLPGTLFDSVSAAWQVFGEASSPDFRDLTPWVVAGVVALAVSAVLATRLRRGPGERPEPSPVSASA